MKRLLVVGIGLISLLSGCGVVRVGESCEKRDDCVPAQECLLNVPGGFCTRGCTEEGTTRDCPEGTICTFFGKSLLVCSPLCQSNGDCRVNYECVEAGGTTARKACRPEGVTR